MRIANSKIVLFTIPSFVVLVLLGDLNDLLVRQVSTFVTCGIRSSHGNTPQEDVDHLLMRLNSPLRPRKIWAR